MSRRCYSGTLGSRVCGDRKWAAAALAGGVRGNLPCIDCSASCSRSSSPAAQGAAVGQTATTPVAVPVPRSARARRSRHAPPMRTAASPGPLPPLVGRSGSAAQPRMRASRVRAPAQAPVLPIAPVRKCRRARPTRMAASRSASRRRVRRDRNASAVRTDV